MGFFFSLVIADMELWDAVLAFSILVFSLAVGIYASRKHGLSTIPIIFLLPFLFVVALVFYGPGSPFFIPSDGDAYLQWGRQLSSSWQMGTDLAPELQLWPGKVFWPLVIAAIDFTFGPTHLALLSLNCLFLGVSIVIIQKVVQLLVRPTGSWVFVVAFGSFSPFVLFGPSLLREAIFWMGLSMGSLAIVYSKERRLGLSSVWLALAGFFLVGVRPDLGFIFLLLLVLLLVSIVGFGWPVRSRKRMIAAVVANASLVALSPQALRFLRPSTSSGAAMVETSQRSLSTPEVITSFSSESGDGYEICDSYLFVKILCEGVIGYPRTLFGPFVWELGLAPIWIIAAFATLHFLVVISFAVHFGLSGVGRNWQNLGILLISVGTLFIFAALLTNYGAMIRFRAATEMLLIPLAIAGWLEVKRRFLRVQ